MAEMIHQQDMLQQIEQSYAAFEAGLAALNEAQMTAPALPGGWSVKDALAHLSVWHRRALDIIDTLETPRVPGIPAGGIDDETVEAFNARFYLQYKDQPLSVALADFRASYLELLACVQRLSDADLMKPLVGGTRTWEITAGNTYDHYPEHLEAIQAAFPQG